MHSARIYMINQFLKSKLDILRCPKCKIGNLVFEDSQEDQGVSCQNCSQYFPFGQEGYLPLIDSLEVNGLKNKMQEFWGDTCIEWYSEFDKNLTAETLYENLDELEKMFRHRKHLAVTEMQLEEIKGKEILEIGSGGGGHSALFKKYGANITSMDITRERVISTARKLSFLREGGSLCVWGDGENLPFIDNSFDIVYSNGVLHHSEDTDKCIEEVYRVLKPNGKAIIMLYCRTSAIYYFNLLPKTLINGFIFKYPEDVRLGLITEGKPKTHSKNPITRVYSKKEILSLFNKFRVESLRKNSFSLSSLPIIGRLRDILMKKLGPKPFKGGIIVYGFPYYGETKSELRLGRYIGFDWNIVARKTL